MATTRNRTTVTLWLSGVASALVAGGIIAGLYVDNNLHYFARDLRKVFAAGYRERSIHISGRRVNYVEGPPNGPALLLLHGQGSDWQDYARVLPTLADRYHVFAVDIFGHGRSDRLPSERYTNALVSEDLAEFLRRVIRVPAVVSGHSSGAIMATWIAAYQPELVAALHLEDPPFYSSIAPRAQMTVGGDVFRVTHNFVTQTEEKDFIRYFVEHGEFFALFGDGKDGLQRYAQTYRAQHPHTPIRFFFLPPAVNAYFRSLESYDPAFGAAWYNSVWYDGFDTDNALGAVRCPTLLIHTNWMAEANGSYYDSRGILMAAMDERDTARTVAHLPADSALVTFPTGHNVHFSHPREFLSTFDRLERIADDRESRLIGRQG